MKDPSQMSWRMLICKAYLCFPYAPYMLPEFSLFLLFTTEFVMFVSVKFVVRLRHFSLLSHSTASFAG